MEKWMEVRSMLVHHFTFFHKVDSICMSIDTFMGKTQNKQSCWDYIPNSAQFNFPIFKKFLLPLWAFN